MRSRSIRRFACLASGVICAGAAQAAPLCDAADGDVIWASCGGGAAAVEILLLPEDAGLTPPGALDVTGGYTARDKRAGGMPKPAGLFVRKGAIVSREYVRFDGVLIVDRSGAPHIVHRRRAAFEGEIYDLEDAARRAAFLRALAAAGASALQSHLLIVDGAIDAFAAEGAPRFRRRILMAMADGSYGLYDSSPRALTLAEATAEVAARFAPLMALNLDMGSYDFCNRGAESGVGERCGALTYGQTGKLSNLIRFSSE